MFYCTPKGTLTTLPVIHASFLAVPYTWEKPWKNLEKTCKNKKKWKNLGKPKNLRIKGPDNPTRQFLPIMSTKSCSGAGKEGKRKKAVEDQEVDKVVGDKIVCERWCVCVTKKDGVCERCCVCESCV